VVSLFLALASGPVVAPPDVAVLGEIQRAARAEQWVSLPIGERTVRVAEFFLGTPYVGGTLDKDPETEVCTVVLDGLDCVTLAPERAQHGLRQPPPLHHRMVLRHGAAAAGDEPGG